MKRLISVSIACLMLALTGCSAPMTKEETAFSAWNKDVYNFSDKSYSANNDMKAEALDEVKPVLDELALILGEKRFNLDTSKFNDDKWFLKACKDALGVNLMQVLQPLKAPLVGSKDSIAIDGYTNEKTLNKVAKELKFNITHPKSDAHILYGSNFDYPYNTRKTVLTKATSNFKIVVESDTAWNALLWKSYQEGTDPGNFDVKNPFPSNKYSPFRVLIYFNKSCSTVKVELSDVFNLAFDGIGKLIGN